MKRYSHALVLIAAGTAIGGCAPYIGTCNWIVPDSNTALRTIEARKPISGECECFDCDAPGRFLLERDGYTIEFWNGARADHREHPGHHSRWSGAGHRKHSTARGVAQGSCRRIHLSGQQAKANYKNCRDPQFQ